MDLKLYVSDHCGFCILIVDFIEEESLKVEILNISSDRKARADVGRIGGKMQVPMMTVDGSHMYESRDIMEFIKDHIEELR